MIFLDFKSFSPDEIIKQFVCNVYLDQIPQSIFFIESIPDNLIIPKLNSIYESIKTENQLSQYFKWMLYCIISRVSEQIQINHPNISNIEKPILPDSFYLLLLESKKVKSKESTLLLQIFSGNNNFLQRAKNPANSKSQNSEEYMNKSVIQSIEYLYENHRGLYTALYRHGYLEAVLLRVGHEHLFNHFKFKAFSLRDKFDSNYLPFFSIKMVNNSNFSELWSQYPILFDSKASQIFQSLFACDNPFPYVSTKYFPEGELNDQILYLTNDVLTKRKTFVDIILIVCRTLIVNGLRTSKDQECFLNYTRQFPDLRILSLFSEFESIRNEGFFDNVIFQVCRNLNDNSNSITKSEMNPIMNDMIERLSNDSSLCIFVANSIGRKTRSSDLERMSLPKYLSSYGNMDFDITSFHNKKLFVINDEDRKNDFAFIYAYQAMRIVLDQVENLEEKESKSDFSESLSFDSFLSFSHSTEFTSDQPLTFSEELSKLIECIKSMTSEAAFEKVIIDLFSLIFIDEKDDENQQKNSMLFTDEKITEIVSILFHFCPQQKEIRKAFSRFKFINLLTQKNFEEAKKLAQNENDPLYKLALIAELISKISNSEQWSFPMCIDKSIFDAEFLLTQNEDFGSDMSQTFPELAILVEKRRMFRKRKNYSPCQLYDIENTKTNCECFRRSEFDRIQKDQLCIQFNDFVDFEQKIQKSGIDNLNSVNEIISFEIKNDKIASLLTLKTVPDEYKNNKIIKEMFRRMNSASTDDLTSTVPEFQSIDDIRNYLNLCDQKLIEIYDNELKDLLSKCFLAKPLPYDILNELYLRNSDFVFEFYKPLINKLAIRDLMNLTPFCYYKYFSEVAKMNENLTLIEFVEKLIIDKKFILAKQISSEFNLNDQLDCIIKKHISKDNINEIKLIYPHLIDYTIEKKSLNEETQILPTEIELKIIKRICEFIELEKSSSEGTFSDLFEIFKDVNHEVNAISSELMQKIVQVVTIMLSSSFVNSLDSEMNAIIILPRLLNYMKSFKFKMQDYTNASNYQTLLSKLECVCNFAYCNFFSCFSESYSFDNFQGKQQGASFASLCQKYDQCDVLRDIQTSWILSDYKFFESSINCIKLGLMKRGKIELENAVKVHMALKTDCQSLANNLIPTLTFLQPFSINSYLSKINSECPFVHQIQAELDSPQNINILDFFGEKDFNSKVQLQFPQIHVTSPQIIALNEFLTIINAIEDRIMFNSQFGFFDEVFSLFTSNNFKLPTFLRIVITPTIAFKQWNSFWVRVIRCLNQFDSLLNDFFLFLNQNKMFFILFDVQKKLHFFDHSIYAAIKLFEISSSYDERQTYLNAINFLIKKSLPINDPVERKIHRLFMPVDFLFRMQHRVNIQLSVISIFKSVGIRFDKNMDIMSTKENALNLASFLLLNLQMGCVSEICDLFDDSITNDSTVDICNLPVIKISMAEVCERAIDTLNMSNEEGKISGFFKNLVKLDPPSYKKVIQPMSDVIRKRVPDDKTFIEFLTSYIKDDELVYSLLIKFGFKSEAKKFMKKKKIKKRK